MSYRFMRVLVMFDLPVQTSSDLKEYRRFRKFLISNGFVMIQQSIYSKIALNGTVANSIRKSVQKNKPSDGLVQLLTITEKQYNRMEFLVGEHSTDTLDTDERFVVF